MAVAQALVVGAGDSKFHWTPATVVLAIFLFFLAGLCEIGGGWLVWQVLPPGWTGPSSCSSTLLSGTDARISLIISQFVQHGKAPGPILYSQLHSQGLLCCALG